MRDYDIQFLLVADSEIDSSMLNFVSEELSIRSMLSQIATVLSHKERSTSSDTMEIVSVMDTLPNLHVYCQWNSNLIYSQHKAKVIDTQPKEIKQPAEGCRD